MNNIFLKRRYFVAHPTGIAMGGSFENIADQYVVGSGGVPALGM